MISSSFFLRGIFLQETDYQNIIFDTCFVVAS